MHSNIGCATEQQTKYTVNYLPLVCHLTTSTNQLCEDALIIPVHWFDNCPQIGIRLPFFRKINETESRKFIKWYWKNTQLRILFLHHLADQTSLKEKNQYRRKAVYHGMCNCGGSYICETSRNFTTRINEHAHSNEQSEPARLAWGETPSHASFSVEDNVPL